MVAAGTVPGVPGIGVGVGVTLAGIAVLLGVNVSDGVSVGGAGVAVGSVIGGCVGKSADIRAAVGDTGVSVGGGSVGVSVGGIVGLAVLVTVGGGVAVGGDVCVALGSIATVGIFTAAWSALARSANPAPYTAAPMITSATITSQLVRLLASVLRGRGIMRLGVFLNYRLAAQTT